MFQVLPILFVFSIGNFYTQNGNAQSIVAGPIQGHTTDTSIHIWIMTKDVKQIELELKSTSENKIVSTKNITTNKTESIDGYHSLQTSFNNLEPDSKYILIIIPDNKPDLAISKEVRTFPVYEENSPEDFSFIIGSCAEKMKKFWIKTIFRPHVWSLFKRIADAEKDQAAFMIWLGDNLYFHNQDHISYSAMMQKYIAIRRDEQLNYFLKSMPQYAIWDDHDFGPNNSERDFKNKDAALRAFKNNWANPSFGTEETKGVFTLFSYQDADFFLLDNRYYKSTQEGTFLGKTQLDWLKEKLLSSKARFKFLCLGLQTLSPRPEAYGQEAFDKERTELFDFIEQNNIQGIIFLSGDRHYGELLKMERPGNHPFYELTSSPLTSLSVKRPLGKKNEKSKNQTRQYLHRTNQLRQNHH